jgi:hypothetical protein
MYVYSLNIYLQFYNTGSFAEKYRCITPLRLLLSREVHPEHFALSEKLMDHNEERQKYKEMWKLQRTYVNDYLKKCSKTNFTDEEYDRAVGKVIHPQVLYLNNFKTLFKKEAAQHSHLLPVPEKLSQ